MKLQYQSPLILALDHDDERQVMTLIEDIDPQLCALKIGKGLFTRYGPAIVLTLQQKGFRIFLDLKFHDIPNTVAHAVTAAADLGVWMVNVHASGGMRMMLAAREALLPFGKNAPLLIAVTVLTSMENADLHDLDFHVSPLEQAHRLAKMAKNAAFDGVVCSAQEAAKFRRDFGREFLLVTPGIRPEGAKNEDQRRIMTPQNALEVGADYLVIGRPITQSSDPLASLKQIITSLKFHQ